MKVKFEIDPANNEVKKIVRKASKLATLQMAHDYLETELSNWFIYLGGKHIAIHLQNGGDRWILITE